MNLGRVKLSILALLLASCTQFAASTNTATIGPNPELPPPTHALVPVVDIAPAIGWAPAPNRARWTGWRSSPSRADSITRVGCTCCPMAMCWLQKRTRRREKRRASRRN